jgi:hypothetical protein
MPLLAGVLEKLPTAFHRSMIVCCHSMLEHNLQVRLSSFNVAKFIFDTADRLSVTSAEVLACQCLLPWQAAGDCVMSL